MHLDWQRRVFTRTSGQGVKERNLVRDRTILLYTRAVPERRGMCATVRVADDDDDEPFISVLLCAMQWLRKPEGLNPLIASHSALFLSFSRHHIPQYIYIYTHTNIYFPLFITPSQRPMSTPPLEKPSCCGYSACECVGDISNTYYTYTYNV